MVKAGIVSPDYSEGGEADDAAPPPAIFLTSFALLLLIFGVVAGLRGIDLGQSTATMVACGAILLFGLPHGSLDLELLRNREAQIGLVLPVLLGMYLTLAALTYAAWLASPLAALMAFLVIAVIHFGEDWQACREPLLAYAIALGALAAPILTHREALAPLFAAIGDTHDATMLTTILMLLAPTALLAAGVACADLWSNGQRQLAVNGLIGLAAMLALPPVVGFAISFCLLHSPMHLRDNVREALTNAKEQRVSGRVIVVVTSLTLAALGIAALLFGLQPHVSGLDRLVSATFITLSVLTVPHMMMPKLCKLWSRRATLLPSRLNRACP